MVDNHITTKDFVRINTLHIGMDKIPHGPFFLKDPEYTMNIISTYGGLLVPTRKISLMVNGNT